MRLLYAIILCFALYSCQGKSKYTYIQIEQKEGLFGDLKVEEKAPEDIYAASDSAAYMEAFRNFTIAEKVHDDMVSSMGKTYTKPLYFKLLNGEGQDISNTTYFAQKDSLEQDMVDLVGMTSSPTALSPSKKSGKMSKDELGDKWPLTVSRGEVFCQDGLYVLFRCSQGTYAVNGTARNWMQKKGWKDIYEIWKTDPADPSRRIPISPVLNRGLDLCEG